MYYLRKILYLAVLTTFISANASQADDFFRAVRGNNGGGITDLIARGFNPNTRDPHGQTGLLMALREPSPKAAKALIESPKTDVNATNASGESPLMMAALKGDQALVMQLLARDAAVNKTGWTPLHYAATNGHVEIMRTLLDHYAFIDAQSPNGTTPLMMAAMYGSTGAVKLLLDEGADVSMKNEQGLSAADFAQRGNRPDAIALLATAVQTKPELPRNGKW